MLLYKQPRSQGPFSTSRKYFLEVERGPFVLCFGRFEELCFDVTLCCVWMILCCVSMTLCCVSIIQCCLSIILCCVSIILCWASIILCCVSTIALLCFNNTVLCLEKCLLCLQIWATVNQGWVTLMEISGQFLLKVTEKTCLMWQERNWELTCTRVICTEKVRQTLYISVVEAVRINPAGSTLPKHVRGWYLS